MTRVSTHVRSRKRRKKVMKAVKGYVGGRSKTYKQAKETLDRALVYAFRDRRAKKRDFRRLWIVRINAAARMNDMSYSQFIRGLILAGVEVDRKILAHLAAHDQDAFRKFAELSKKSIEKHAQ